MAFNNPEEKLSGLQKASIVMMTVDEEVAAKVFSMMTEDEIREISHTMASLGSVPPTAIDDLMNEFSEDLSSGATLVGDLMNTQKLLTKALGAERVETLMEDISGPSGKNTWDKLNNVGEELLASFLQNEYPQTAALVLSKIRPAQAARVVGIFPEDFAIEVIERMLTLEPVKREILHNVERTLHTAFMTSLSSTKQTDSFETMAEIFNNFDRNTESRFLDILDKKHPEHAEHIRELMFTFDDLLKIDGAGIQTILRKADKDKLTVALKGANDKIRDMFFENMSERAAKLMQEDMESRGPVRMRDVDEAQTAVVAVTKALADSGEIVIPDNEEEEMIY